MNSKGFPYVSSYQSYFSYEANLNLFDPIISDKIRVCNKCSRRGTRLFDKNKVQD